MGDLRFARRLLAAAVTAAGLLAAATLPAAAAEKITVFAAASTTDALTEVGAAFAKETGVEMVPSFASSSTLAKQIEEGAPAQVFVSANAKWMDYLADKGLVVADSRADLLGNDLVLIAPADSAVATVAIGPGLDLAPLLDGGRLSVGDPDHVPVGQYAKAALEKLGLWAATEPQLARQNDVRSALALVERGEAPLGIVYSTDAAASNGVKTVGVFPKDSHSPITYPVALVTDSPAGRSFLAFLQSDAAKAIFARHGFTVN
ncbi:molybdate ABC transporter substrate-binding protein [Caenispirillum bisanense]|uniref:Molybdate transport system substrate-binding protein n=1 Tax=Caenispirillum bisanense TaxID=414052 RepID=A0A286GIL3_9PROT|nr:molybdate ABC transporter substrate-binding protein [Caenispirillum bisanense]SOD95312.1 molybdate transport system substrate-binding protein [Caenispirillum bisanense]